MVNVLYTAVQALRLTGPLEIYARARLASRRLVKLDVIRQLGVLRCQLRGRVLALRSLDLQRQHRQLQLEHLVLDLAVLKRLPSGRVLAASGVDGVVEPARVNLCGLGCLPRRFEDGKIPGVD